MHRAFICLEGSYSDNHNNVLMFRFVQRDAYNNIPAIDPEKLKIFSTVREITGVCFHVTLIVVL